jgi:hypothetical protein
MSRQQLRKLLENKLFDKFENFKTKLYEELLLDDSEKITKWQNDSLDSLNDNFKPMINGDWTRIIKYKQTNQNTTPPIKYYKNQIEPLDLSKLFNEPRPNVNKSMIFKLLKDELERPWNGSYTRNFNPNWFFLLFEEFVTCTFEKNGTKFRLLPKAIKNTKGEVIGISIDYDPLLVRHEIIKIIEIHSMFIFNPKIYRILGDKLFTNIFIKNAFIQNEILTFNYNKEKNYTDLTYVINKNPDVFDSKEVNTIIEILENHHNTIEDNIRSLDILSVGEGHLLSLNVSKKVSCDIEFKKFLPSFCKDLYKAGYHQQAIILHMVENNSFDIDKATFGVNLKFGTLNMELKSFTSLPIFDNELTKENLINDTYSEMNEECFKNWNEVYEKYVKNLYIVELIDSKNPTVYDDKLYKYIMEQLFKFIMENGYDELELTNIGIKTILSNIKNRNWSGKESYIKYQNDIEENYIMTIKDFLSKDEESLYKTYFLQTEHLIQLQDFNINEFIKSRNRYDKYKNLNEVRKEFPNLEFDPNLHLPYLRLSEGKFIKLKLYLDLIYHNRTEEQKKERYDSINSNKIEIIAKEEYLMNYEVMSPQLVDAFNKKMQIISNKK